MAPGISSIVSWLAPDAASVVDRLRRSTVEVRDTGGSSGCGVIWESSGAIVTNAHVVRSRRPIVLLPGGRPVEANLVAWDVERDLAVLRVAADGLLPITVRDSSTIRAGELVLAMGSPWGLSGSAALGIIHGLGSSDRVRGGPWLQASIRLAPGNSGGPLADADGRLVGLNAMVSGETALAIPSNEIERFISRAFRGRREAA